MRKHRTWCIIKHRTRSYRQTSHTARWANIPHGALPSIAHSVMRQHRTRCIGKHPTPCIIRHRTQRNGQTSHTVHWQTPHMVQWANIPHGAMGKPHMRRNGQTSRAAQWQTSHTALPTYPCGSLGHGGELPRSKALASMQPSQSLASLYRSRVPETIRSVGIHKGRNQRFCFQN